MEYDALLNTVGGQPPVNDEEILREDMEVPEEQESYTRAELAAVAMARRAQKRKKLSEDFQRRVAEFNKTGGMR